MTTTKVKIELESREARAVLNALKARVRHLGLNPETTVCIGAVAAVEESLEVKAGKTPNDNDW